MQRVTVKVPAQSSTYEIVIGQKLLPSAGRNIRRTLGRQAQRLTLVSNKKVFNLYGPAVVETLEASGFQVSCFLMGDGERYKSLETANRAVQFLSSQGVERIDGVVALGGGVTGDLAGFAAAIYLRGISFVQIPTTLVAQVDSSVGGKVGVNLSSGKNRAGAFQQPRIVIADVATIQTLPARELTSGWCECIKQGAVGNRKLYKQTTDYLSQLRSGRVAVSPALEKLIASHCAFKASIVRADERENPGRTDRRSRRVLNFGHTVGHVLESLTNYQRFRHGEAVGWGMLVAGELSKNLGLLDESELESLRRGVRLCGQLPAADDLDVASIINAISRDKKSVRGAVQWVLLERIGRPRIVSNKEIDRASLKASIRDALRKRTYE